MVFKKGRIILNGKVVPGIGGGFCNLANTINHVVLHSPLDITELHFHSDSVTEETEHKVFSSGTSISYNYLDYRFKNNTDQNFQLFTWCDETKFYAELRSQKPVEYEYDLVEENRLFEKINKTYYCLSKIYKITKEKYKKLL